MYEGVVVCVYMCVSMHGWMVGWMDGCVCVYVGKGVCGVCTNNKCIHLSSYLQQGKLISLSF